MKVSTNNNGHLCFDFDGAGSFQSSWGGVVQCTPLSSPQRPNELCTLRRHHEGAALHLSSKHV